MPRVHHPAAAVRPRAGSLVPILAALCLGAGQASAQAPADALRLYVERAVAGMPGRVEVSVGRLDDRLQLAPCGRVEPYVPPGARLWGRTQIGLRCQEGANWNVYLPVEVRVYAQALVATRQIAYGATVGPEDAKVEEVELTRETGTAVADWSLLDGRTATRVVVPGQVLRAEYFRAPPAVGAGDTVRLVLNGDGFTITSNGRALGTAADGQSVRVQTDSGRIVQGIARAGRTVEMRL